MKFLTLFPRLLMALGLFLILTAPSRAASPAHEPDLALGGKGKPKKGVETPRPTPQPGPVEDGDDN